MRFGRTNHWSCTKTAAPSGGTSRARLVGVEAVEAAELAVLRPTAGEEVGPVVEDVDAAPVALKTWSMLVSLYSAPPLMTCLSAGR